MKRIFIITIALFGISGVKAQKVIEPVIGETRDISVNAAKNIKKLYATIDSLINTYPNYEAAKKHLTQRQIEIWENEEEYSREDHLDVSIWGCSWYCGGGPDRIFASSELKPSGNLTYKANNAHDFSLRTAWVEGVQGYGIGESITYRFEKLSPPVTTVEIFNGYMKSDEVWQDNSRVKQLKVYVNGNPYALLNLKDIKSRQLFKIGSHQGKKSDLYLKFEIVDVYPGDKYDDTAISEIEFDGTGVHCFTKETMIAVPNGEKQIAHLKAGDKILTLNRTTNSIETATILALANQKHHNLYELDFGGVKIETTDDHPFYFNEKYYSIVENNKYGVTTNAFSIGQSINFLIKGEVKTVELKGIKKLDRCEETFTITKLDRNNLFFANGICVTTEEL
ncbi:MAG: hypothetical protein LBT29_05345 [Flavobacteriaceae bacterium]|jgi:hypothetical protein|nr:hypothetical protein [Flavobacteriaceae bacterium]